MYILFFLQPGIDRYVKNKYNNYQNQVVYIPKIIQYAFFASSYFKFSSIYTSICNKFYIFVIK